MPSFFFVFFFFLALVVLVWLFWFEGQPVWCCVCEMDWQKSLRSPVRTAVSTKAATHRNHKTQKAPKAQKAKKTQQHSSGRQHSPKRSGSGSSSHDRSTSRSVGKADRKTKQREQQRPSSSHTPGAGSGAPASQQERLAHSVAAGQQHVQRGGSQASRSRTDHGQEEPHLTYSVSRVACLCSVCM